MPRFGSNIAELTVAVFDSEPVAAGLIEHTEVNVTEPPIGKVIPLLLILPANGPAVLPVAPPAATLEVKHVKVPGNVSATVTPVAVLGPEFEAAIA